MAERNASLYRAKLNASIGKRVLNGDSDPPQGATPQEYALYLILCALEDIADGIARKEE